MNVAEFTSILVVGSMAAGLLGSLTGLGGGVVIVPLLTIGFGVDIRYAIGASLVSVIATSSGAAAAYVREGYSNIRIGMFLEIATSMGALSGAFLASRLPGSAIGIVFGIVLLYSAYESLRKNREREVRVVRDSVSDRLAAWLNMNGSYPVLGGHESYLVRNVPIGFGLMAIAGILSGMLGIGSGALKVIAMDRAMRLPFKVSTTTSNFMIGVTAAASAGVYLSRGYIDPVLSMPVVLGVLFGSFLGARMLARASSTKLRLVFAVVVAVLAIEMIYTSLTGRL